MGFSGARRRSIATTVSPSSSTLHEIDGFDANDPKTSLVQSLGLNRSLQLIDVGDLYEVRGSALGAPFILPRGLEAALAAATKRFPGHKSGLKEYFRRLAGLRAAASFASRHRDDGGWWLTHAPTAVRRLWPVLRSGRPTVGATMRELFRNDEAVKFALAANLSYWTTIPSECCSSRSPCRKRLTC